MPTLSTQDKTDLAAIYTDYLNGATSSSYQALTVNIGIGINSAYISSLLAITEHMAGIAEGFVDWVGDQGTVVGNCIVNNNTIADASMCVVVHYENS